MVVSRHGIGLTRRVNHQSSTLGRGRSKAGSSAHRRSIATIIKSDGGRGAGGPVLEPRLAPPPASHRQLSFTMPSVKQASHWHEFCSRCAP